MGRGIVRHAFGPWAVALLLAVPAMAASQRDYDDCSPGTEFDRRIAGCTRILQEGTQPAQNRIGAYALRGGAYADKGDHDRAIADYTEAIRLAPAESALYGNRGRAYLDKRDYFLALADFSEVIRLDPRDASTYNDRGAVHAGKGDHDRAIADYDEAIRLAPTDATFYGSRGRAYAGKHDNLLAIADFSEAIRLNPRDAAAYNDRGLALANAGDAEKGIADFEAAARIAPSVPAYSRNLAEARNSRGWLAPTPAAAPPSLPAERPATVQVAPSPDALFERPAAGTATDRQPGPFDPIPVEGMSPGFLRLVSVAQEKRRRFLEDGSFSYSNLALGIEDATKAASELDRQGRPAEAIQRLKALESIRPIEEIPTPHLIDVYGALHGRIGDLRKQAELRDLLFGINQAIAHSGDATSPETAIQVIFPGEEYAWLAARKVSRTKQGIVNRNGRIFDVLTGKDADGNEREYFFDITALIGKYTQGQSPPPSDLRGN